MPSHARTSATQSQNAFPDHLPKGSNTQKLCNSSAVWKQSQLSFLVIIGISFELQKDKTVNVHSCWGNRMC